MLTEMNIKNFVEQVASDSAAPGGGSVAALSAAAGAGLVAMLANLTKNKKGYEEVSGQMAEIAEYCSTAAQRFVSVIDEDTKAFDAYMSAIKLPKDTDEQKAARAAAMQKAAEGATMVPLNLAKDAFLLFEKARYAIANGNKNALSDGAVAVLMIRSGILGAIYNVKINLGMLKNQELVLKIKQEADRLEAETKNLEAEILKTVNL